MALTPESNDKLAIRKAAQEDALLREVDDAVREDDLAQFAQKYGKPLLGLLVAGLVAFGGYLYWDTQQEAALEKSSEDLVKALDLLEAGNIDAADTALVALTKDGSAGAVVAAKLQLAGIAMQKNKLADAIKLYDEVAADSSVPQPYRDAATLRSVSANFDKLEAQAVIDRLKPLAVPGNPWFGSAGEMVAMAYLEQGKKDLAGSLFSEISKDEQVPETLRSRARQMAGLLGVDAIVDVKDAIGETATAEDAGVPAAAAE